MPLHGNMKENGITSPDIGLSVALIDSEKFSCNECKRRRIKCSREIPLCKLCRRYKRHCLYEKHKKTPLTRKHLTEVEEELSLIKDLLEKCFPDVDIPDLLTKKKNGMELNEIPEISMFLKANCNKHAKSNEKFQMNFNNNLGAPNGDRNTPNIYNITAQNNTSTDMESILGGNFTEGRKKSPVINNHLSKIDSNFNSSDFQIPQLLPSTISLENRSLDLENRPKRKRIINNPLELSSKSSYSSYNWDERLQPNNRQPSIIEGMATKDENGYLGSPSNAALINWVGGGFFFYDTKMNKGDEDASPNSLSIHNNKITKQKMEYYIDQYFEIYHVSYPIIHKPIFMAQFNGIIPTPEIGWESLLYVVAAIGSFMSAVTPDDNDDLELFAIAKSKLAINVLESGNIILVQTLTLMSNYLQKRDRPNSGYNYLGIAVRMALALGIHKQIEESEENLLNQEINRRVWWCLFVFDCGQTITYGRPFSIPCAGIDSRLPLNIIDSNLTTQSTSLPCEEDEPTVFTSVRLQSLFHLFTNGIYERIITDPFPSAECLLNWDQLYLRRWISMIPNYFREGADVPIRFKLAHAVLEWRYRNLRILMYRTFLLRRVILNPKLDCDTSNNEFETQASEICLNECSSTINSMANFWKCKNKHNRMDAWYSLYFLIPAVLMPLVCLRNDPNSTYAEYWRIDIASAQNIIQELLNICPPACKILDLINSLGTGYFTTQANSGNVENSYATTGTDESPLSQLNNLHSMLWPVSFDIEQQFLQ